MTKKELIQECIQLIEEGCDIVEVFEYIEDNSDLDPTEIIDIIYRKQVLFI